MTNVGHDAKFQDLTPVLTLLACMVNIFGMMSTVRILADFLFVTQPPVRLSILLTRHARVYCTDILTDWHGRTVERMADI